MRDGGSAGSVAFLFKTKEKTQSNNKSPPNPTKKPHTKTPQQKGFFYPSCMVLSKCNGVLSFRNDVDLDCQFSQLLSLVVSQCSQTCLIGGCFLHVLSAPHHCLYSKNPDKLNGPCLLTRAVAPCIFPMDFRSLPFQNF